MSLLERHVEVDDKMFFSLAARAIAVVDSDPGYEEDVAYLMADVWLRNDASLLSKDAQEVGGLFADLEVILDPATLEEWEELRRLVRRNVHPSK